MATKHPYISATGPLIQVIEQLRKAFPATVNAETLKKLGLVPNNESFAISVLKFIGVLDDEGKKATEGGKVFSQDDDGFQKGFRTLVRNAYSDLFEVRGDDAWTLDKEKLVSYFRNHDESSALVGQRQASTFQALAGLSGYGAPRPMRKSSPQRPGQAREKRARKASGSKETVPATTILSAAPTSGREIGLTVRIEINLPAEGGQETYDRIFKSIRENLLNVV